MISRAFKIRHDALQIEPLAVNYYNNVGHANVSGLYNSRSLILQTIIFARCYSYIMRTFSASQLMITASWKLANHIELAVKKNITNKRIPSDCRCTIPANEAFAHKRV